MTDEYVCAHCNTTYKKVATDEHAMSEYTSLFPFDDPTESELVLICDDCFKQLVTVERLAIWNTAQRLQRRERASHD